MVFSLTKMENEARRGVLLKKHCWIICSSPREDTEFFRNLTQNTLLTRVFLVLPKIHSLDARVSLEERFVKCRMHKRKHFTENFNYFIQIHLIFSTKYAKASGFSFFFSRSEHGNKQPIQLQIKFDWCLKFLNLAYLYMFVHTHHPKPKAAVYFERVQPARRQSVMVHVSMSVACTARNN